jgi:trans-aconitate methyltransferase
LVVLDWDHNAYYHRLLIRQLPPHCQQALDVGCGAGAFGSKFAERCEHVDALDRSDVMIKEARRRAPDNMKCVLANVLTDALPRDTYDAIFSINALHHMPLAEVLPKLATALRPGGVLAVIALPRRCRHHRPRLAQMRT